mmetsp:Transcript_1756/g.4037  ORF Transcript_1756/g.4037 Transcript_1756/m.4037 type:complete len:511 (+) Transcript_1756:411-1943(+)
MSFSSRRRNYLLTPHRRDGLVEWMKEMLMHSFVLDCLEDTGADTFEHFETLIEEHRKLEDEGSDRPSRLKQLVPTVGSFKTPLPLRQAFTLYNEKHKITKRKHIQISFNELRHILNLAQILAMRKQGSYVSPEATQNYMNASISVQGNDDLDSGNNLKDLEKNGNSKKKPQTSAAEDKSSTFDGPAMITFDGDQTLYTDGANFDSNPRLARYILELLRNGVVVAVVTAAGYEYNVEKYEYRLSGLLNYFKDQGLTPEECERFVLFGGECNYLVHLGSDYHLHPVKEYGRGGWLTATKFLPSSPANWDEKDITALLDVAEAAVNDSVEDQNLYGRVIRKKRSIGLVPDSGQKIPRESLDETVLRCQGELQRMNNHAGPLIPFCAFNGGRDVWVDVGNKRVGVEILGAFLGVEPKETLHIGDQFLNTGNDFAARDICPCVWVTSPEETTYVLKTILRFAGASYQVNEKEKKEVARALSGLPSKTGSVVDFAEVERRVTAVQEMDVFTGELKK